MKRIAALSISAMALAAIAPACKEESRASVAPRQIIFASAPRSPFAVGSRPTSIAVEDINRDGKLDIITANRDSNNATVLLGDGQGDFLAAPQSPFAAGTAPEFVAIGDLNGDKNPDLVFAQHAGGYNLTILSGDGKGKFLPARKSLPAPLKSTDPHNHGLVLIDVNRDGNLDILTANAGSNAGRADNSMSVLLGNGRGGFRHAAGSPLSIGRLPASIVISDVNRDSKMDIVTANEGAKDISMFLGDGIGRFKSAASFPFSLPTYANDIAIGDVNRDSNPDFVITHDDSSLVTLLLADGAGGFKAAPGSPFDLGHHAWNIIVCDVDGDSSIDIVMRGPNDRIMILLG
ncbi:MAG: VCBS repeat-containing protein, partial [Acidobacteriota bacterium]